MRFRYGFIACLAVPLLMLSHNLVSQSSPPDRGAAMRRMALYEENPMTGTWKLNISKSQFNPGPALRSGKVRTEIHGSSFKCVLDPVDSEGRARHGEWTAKLDGKDYPAGMSSFADAIALKMIAPNTIEAMYKRAGKPILNERIVFSEDRKTLTMTQKEITQTGKGFNNTLVYDRE